MVDVPSGCAQVLSSVVQHPEFHKMWREIWTMISNELLRQGKDEVYHLFCCNKGRHHSVVFSELTAHVAHLCDLQAIR